MKYGSLKVEIHVNQRVSLIQSWNSKQPVFLWLFQLDDSKSLHKKRLFHQTSIKKWLFRVPGWDKDGIISFSHPLFFCVLFAVKSQAAGKPIESKRISLQKMAISWVHGYKKGSQKHLTHSPYPSIVDSLLLRNQHLSMGLLVVIDSWWRLRNYRLFHPTGWTQLRFVRKTHILAHQRNKRPLELKAISIDYFCCGAGGKQHTTWFYGKLLYNFPNKP